MTFNPKQFGLVTRGSLDISRTRFRVDNDIISVESDGLPWPAQTSNKDFTRQNYDYKFYYRAGGDSQSPHSVSVGEDIALFANGIPLQVFEPAKVLPMSNNVRAPAGLDFNLGFFADMASDDSAHAKVVNGKYIYRTGKFLSSSWKNNGLYIASTYYSNTNFSNDYLRHPDGHSKIIGFCFDGYPIYGPWGYSSPTSSSSLVRTMKTSHVPMVSDNHRPNGWKYTSQVKTYAGIKTLAPGSFVQDYVFDRRAGDLDEHNGRFCVTPDFPNGTYAYFTTFDDDTLTTPTYPYVVGPSTKQYRTLFNEIPARQEEDTSLWNIATGERLTTLVERRVVEINLPVANGLDIKLELISGTLPAGLQLSGTKLVGTVFEVAYYRTFTFVLRATSGDLFEDRTFDIIVAGPDAPEWQTPQGLLPIHPNERSLFVLDSELIDYQLLATDSDLPAGDVLTYYIDRNEGSLPPGLSLTDDGRIVGIVEPLLSLEKRYLSGGYDTAPYEYSLFDYATLPDNGYSSFYYDSESYDFSIPTRQRQKLNRLYPFTVTVTDGVNFVQRDFKIFVVGDDFLTSDNTIMKAANGVFTADVTNLRNPVWLTPKDLGFKRADNYTTLFLDIIDNPTLEGRPLYTLDDENDDGSTSELPPGLSLDTTNGEIAGYIPYQPAITESYKFTVRATRMIPGLDRATIFANFYEDTLLGRDSFKIYKFANPDELLELRNRTIRLYGRQYTVKYVDDSNPNYDVINLDNTLSPARNLLVSRQANIGQDNVFVSRLSVHDRDLFRGHVLNFSSTEKYTITSITPYLEYKIRQLDPSSDPLYPAQVPTTMEEFDNFFVGDFAINPDDNIIYQCTTEHTFSTFEPSNWDEVAADITELSTANLAAATKQALEKEFGGDVYVVIENAQNWTIRLPSNARTRNITTIENFFALSADSAVVNVRLTRDNEDRIVFDINLMSQLSAGRNIGIALFKDDSFRKEIIVSERNEDSIPSTPRTFVLRVIGEIDSNIEWITPSNLGTINANFDSVLNVQAQTTVPDTKMIYTIKSGQLPYGMRLSLDGEIIGQARQFASDEGLGLTTFDDSETTWDESFTDMTSFDREFHFVVEARDRFNYSAIEREFVLRVSDQDATQYTDVFFRPMLKQSERQMYREFLSSPGVFEPSKIYRPSDPNFGVQQSLDMLLFAGVEAKKIEEFVAASAKNHKRKKYILGDLKTAVARESLTGKVIYEVIYIEVIDPADTDKGRVASQIQTRSKEKITVDSIQYAVKDDIFRTNAGYDSLAVYKRGTVRFAYTVTGKLVVDTRSGEVSISPQNKAIEVGVRPNGSVSVQLEVGDSEPYRIRPKANTIKADSNAVLAGSSTDTTKYISNITNMRENIKEIGLTERNYLPLWMRTSQQGLQELDYQPAIPVCYCKPGTSQDILRNIRNFGFEPNQINYDIDRYVVKRTEDYSNEQYIIFANYQFNV